MAKLSGNISSIVFGPGSDELRLERGTVDAAGSPPFTRLPSGNALALIKGDNGGDDTYFYAKGGVWNALWNDIADFQLLDDELTPGKCYFDTQDGAKICNKRCQMSLIGICSDTFGMAVGAGANAKEVPIAVAGWSLAYVDKEYECGTPLTNDEDGNLTAITREEKLEFPERIIALYKKKEPLENWGSESKKVVVDGRHWVKVR